MMVKDDDSSGESDGGGSSYVLIIRIAKNGIKDISKHSHSSEKPNVLGELEIESEKVHAL